MIITDLRALYLNPIELKEAIVSYVRARYDNELMIEILENNDCSMKWSKNMTEFIITVDTNGHSSRHLDGAIANCIEEYEEEIDLYTVYGGD